MRLRLALLGILCAACGSAAPPVEHAWGRASPIAEPASLPAPTADPASADHLAELADEAARQIELGVEAARRDRDVVWLWCLVERRDEATAARDAIGAASASLAASDDPAAVLDAMRAEAAAALEAQAAARRCLGEDAFHAGPTRALADG
ncbi:MAG: hypothetical protein H6719_07735 [Sandaracinaceae bacterium]|nr:hypothetical protein [Sandaracinaceae bacterium]